MAAKNWTIPLAVLLAVTGCGTSQGDPYQLKVGECLKAADESGLVEEVRKVPCEEPHAAEVFAALVVSGETYPGRDELQKQAEGCAPEFREFIGKAYTQSDLKITYFHPTEESWGQGDRQILCIVSVPNGTVTKSLEGSSR